MILRRKSFLTYFLLCAVPLLLLAALNYWNGMRAVDATLHNVVQEDLNSFTAGVVEVLRDQESAMLRLSLMRNIQQAVEQSATQQNTGNQQNLLQQNQSASSSLKSLLDLRSHFQSLAVFDSNHQPLWFGTASTQWENWTKNNSTPPNLPQPDERIWTTKGNVIVDKPGTLPSSAPSLEYTVPIHNESGSGNVGALVGVLDLESIFSTVSRGLEARASSGTTEKSMVIVLDHSAKVVYHSDRWLKLRPASEAIPGFESIARSMTANEQGIKDFHTSSGTNFTVAYAPMGLNVAVAVARNRSDAAWGARLWGVAGFVIALLSAFVAALLLNRHVEQKSQGIARVTEDLNAIAKGELDRRILLKSSDDARVIADNINVVTERLRAQVAREAESRQFESFLRLSAMLTHDLKNAIEALSLTVSNMERHFDNPQFRTDAMRGLTDATNKLKAIVARLSKPMTSLSGEHKRPTNVDLVPILKRVCATTAEPLRVKHTIELRLPDNVFALVDQARIEEVAENLILNALEAMAKPGGTLTIEAGHTEGGLPMFAIGDTGPGMSKVFIENRLFRPFATTKKTGIGLGLYTCREVVLASGGTIDVHSVEGVGTTFRVVLPSSSQR
ncbi:MAG TPA: ATP-binding protein [Pyrinomonadaceae bacterium]|nr:ATP-binding protein [Pyrinomonadaceae bacterium]